MATKEYNIKLKNNWNEVTIDDYFKLKGVKDNYDIIEILTDKTKEQIMEMDVETLASIMEEVDFIHTNPQLDESLLNNEFSILTDSGETYEYRLNLNIPKWSAGRFEDSREFAGTTPEQTEENLHLLIGIVCDRIVRERRYLRWTKDMVPYSDRDVIMESEQIYKHFPISYALTLVSFFLDIIQNIVETTPSSLDFQTMITENMIQILEKIQE